MTNTTSDKQTNSDKIDAFRKNVSADLEVEYAQLVASLDTEGLSVEEVDKLYAECRKARSQRMVRELGY